MSIVTSTPRFSASARFSARDTLVNSYIEMRILSSASFMTPEITS